MPGVAIGEPVRSNGVGVVVETNNPDEYPLGRAFMHLTGWQQYCVARSRTPFPPITIVPEDVELLDMLGVLGHIGITAYLGVARGREAATGRDVPRVGRGERRRVDRGSDREDAGRARHRHRGLGRRSARGSSTSSASTRASTTRPKTSRRGSRSSRRRASTSSSTTSAASCSTRCCAGSRCAAASCCAATSRPTTSTGPPPPLHNMRYLMGKRARMEGFNTLDHWDALRTRRPRSSRRGSPTGSIKHREHVLDGLDRAPEALVRLFAGDHLGKLVVRRDR